MKDSNRVRKEIDGYSLNEADFLDLEWEDRVTASRSNSSSRRSQPLNLTSQIEGYLRSIN